MGKMRQFRRGLRSAIGKPLLYQIKDGYGAVLSGLLEQVIRGDRIPDAEIKDAFDDSAGLIASGLDFVAAWDFSAGPMIIPGGKGQKATALVSLRGIAMYDVEMQPVAFSTLMLSQTMNALANDPEVGTIVLDIDSPGGMVTGTPEAADAIYNARRKKKTVALINPLAASAAYWLASQCEEVIAVPSADVGSIGVFMAHTDCSKMMEDMGLKTTYIHAGKYKIEGNPDEPLSEDARAYYQMEVDSIYAAFQNAVARGRGVSVENVEKKYGQGRTLMAPAAKRAGMVDRVETIDMALSRFGLMVSAPQQGRRRGEAAADDIPVALSDGEMIVVGIDSGGDDHMGIAFIDASQSESTVDVTMTVEDDKVKADYNGCADITAEQQEVIFNRLAFAAECGVVNFTQRISEDGTPIVYVENEWPQKVEISNSILTCGSDSVDDDGDRVTFTVANGLAVYSKVMETSYGDWLCTLQESTYEPMPEATASEDAGDEAVEAAFAAAREAAEQAERERLVGVRARRLKLLRLT